MKRLTKRFIEYIWLLIEMAKKELDKVKQPDEEELELLERMDSYYHKFAKLNNRNRLIEDIQDNNVHSSDEFDADPYLFPVKNGILNLKAFDPKSGETVKLLPHDPKYLITKVANVTFEPNKVYPRFDRFVEEVMQGQKDKIRYLAATSGYAMLGIAPEECLFLILGTLTRNGKSVYYDSLLTMFGELGIQIDPDTLLRSGGIKSGSQAKPDLLRMKGARLIIASEPTKGSYLNEGLLKSLTGNDIQTCRNLYQGEYTQFRNSGTIFLCSNNSPCFTDDSIFSSKRMRILSFNRHFKPEEQDKTLKEKFRTEDAKSAILNFCLKGLTDYFTNGLVDYNGMNAELEEYQYSCDFTQQFIDEHIIPLNSKSNIYSGIKLIELRKSYATFSQNIGIKPLGLRDFREDLIKHGVKVRTLNHQYYAMCRVKTELDSEQSADNGDNDWRKHHRDGCVQ